MGEKAFFNYHRSGHNVGCSVLALSEREVFTFGDEQGEQPKLLPFRLRMFSRCPTFSRLDTPPRSS